MAQYTFGQSTNPESGKNVGVPYIIGRVKSIVLGKYKFDGSQDSNYKNPKDLGKITFEILYSGLSSANINEASKQAYPVFSFIKQYPAISEIVYIIPGPSSDLNDSTSLGDYYYFPPYSLWNSVNHNAFPNMQEYQKYLQEFYSSEGYANKLRNAGDFPKLPIGVTLEENSDVRNLRPFEGDVILESRFGQSIRFGSTVLASKTQNTWSNSGDPGSPITIIRNGQGKQKSTDFFEQTVEDINVDDCTIWMTSNQEIVINNIADYPLKSYGVEPIAAKAVVQKYDIATSNTVTSAAAQDIANLK